MPDEQLLGKHKGKHKFKLVAQVAKFFVSVNLKKIETYAQTYFFLEEIDY